MEFDEFVILIQDTLTPGTEFENPGGGTSLIESISGQGITYKRANSSISVRFHDMYQAFEEFNGRTVTTTELKHFLPSVYDSSARPSGHDCNCTFLFQVLNAIGHASEIQGRGVKGSPFSASVV
ncbi:MAG: hypothetical protein ACSHXZ_10765 [Gammaproteobacteria bacterium]